MIISPYFLYANARSSDSSDHTSSSEIESRTRENTSPETPIYEYRLSNRLSYSIDSCLEFDISIDIQSEIGIIINKPNRTTSIRSCSHNISWNERICQICWSPYGTPILHNLYCTIYIGKFSDHCQRYDTMTAFCSTENIYPHPNSIKPFGGTISILEIATCRNISKFISIRYGTISLKKSRFEYSSYCSSSSRNTRKSWSIRKKDTSSKNSSYKCKETEDNPW